MVRIRVVPFRKVLGPALALAAVTACAPTFEARVARFSALPPQESKSFVIEARNPENVGGLEFATYANLVRKEMLANGFVEGAPGQAGVTLLLDYTVGPPRERIQTRPGFNSGWGGPGWGWNPYWGVGGGWGGGSAWGGGWGGGGWGGGWGGTEVYSVTQFNAQLAMKMVRNADKAALFEGRAETVSTTNNLTRLVPNLVRAMFTSFPGTSGETVRVRFNPDRPDQPANVRPVN